MSRPSTSRLGRVPGSLLRRAGAIPKRISAALAPQELIGRARMARLRRRFGSMGPGTFIEWPIDVLTEPQFIQIGEHVRIRKHVRLEVARVTADSQPGRVVIGDRTSMEGYCSICSAASIEIGADVLFGANVAIRDADHGFSDVNVHRAAQPLLTAPVRIGDFVWLGQNVVVTRGTTIGRGAVVGANAVVTADVPEGAVVAGVPARQIGWADGRPFSRPSSRR
jgi:acetyltransferase-like isoleucine patch superfamily enzyme